MRFAQREEAREHELCHAQPMVHHTNAGCGTCSVRYQAFLHVTPTNKVEARQTKTEQGVDCLQEEIVLMLRLKVLPWTFVVDTEV